MKFKPTDEWESLPTETESGRRVIVTRQIDIDEAAKSGHFPFRVDINMKYSANPDGMPDDAAADLLDQVTESLKDTFIKDPAAILACIYTGDGERDWICYAHSLGVFRNIFNRALQNLPLLDLQIEACTDPSWEEYYNF